MKTATQNYVVSANGTVLGVYAGIDRDAALLAHVQDAGYASIEDAAAVLEESVEDFIARTKVELVKPLSERIEIKNAKIVADDSNYVKFSIAVDGNVVHETLEWIDEERDLVRNDSHLFDGDRSWASAVSKALDFDASEFSEIYEVVHEKLRNTVEELKEAA